MGKDTKGPGKMKWEIPWLAEWRKLRQKVKSLL
jgi:hypothetical protein